MSAPFLGNETEISGREKQPTAIRKQNHRYKSPHRRILRLDTGQHVYQLKLSRCMSVFRSRFIRVRMDNRRAMFDMDMNKQRDTAVVGDKNHRQQPFQIFSHRLSHALIVWKVQN